MKAPSYIKRQLWVAMAAILLVVTAAIGATVGAMYRTFDDTIAPQVLAKAGLAGRSMSGLISQAVLLHRKEIAGHWITSLIHRWFSGTRSNPKAASAAAMMHVNWRINSCLRLC
jgi:hypothetical protein